jgi:hypothetical protein
LRFGLAQLDHRLSFFLALGFLAFFRDRAAIQTLTVAYEGAVVSFRFALPFDVAGCLRVAFLFTIILLGFPRAALPWDALKADDQPGWNTQGATQGGKELRAGVASALLHQGMLH